MIQRPSPKIPANPMILGGRGGGGYRYQLINTSAFPSETLDPNKKPSHPSEVGVHLHASIESSSRLRRKSATCCTKAMISGCGWPSRDESCRWNNVAM